MKNQIIFVVPGEPVGKGRPRFYRRGKGVGTYTPDKTIEYEARIQHAFVRGVISGNCPTFPEDVPLRLEILATFGIPKSASKVKIKEMLEGTITLLVVISTPHFSHTLPT